MMTKILVVFSLLCILLMSKVGFADDTAIFSDGFESGDTSAWSSTTPDITPPPLPTSPPPPPSPMTTTDTRPLLRLSDGRMMRVNRVEVTVIIIIIESPLGRFVLKREGDKARNFIPSQIIALGKVDSSDRILNISGKSIAPIDLKGHFRARFAGAGIYGTEPISLDTLAEHLKKNLESRKKFGQTCFDAYKEAEQSNAPEKKRPRSRTLPPPTETEIIQGEAVGIPAITGPVIACGEIANGKKALAVYDGSGMLVETITLDMVEDNANIVSDILRVSQASTDDYIKITKTDIDALSKDFKGVPIGQIERAAATAPPQKKKKKKKKKPEIVVEPNDPFYHLKKKKRKRLLGILGGESPSIKIGKGTSMGGLASSANIGGPTKTREIKDQYGLKQIGYSAFDDPDSAWNIINAETKNVVVAVIDSGLDFDHPDGPQNIWTNTKEIPDNNKDDDHNGAIDDIHGWNFLNENHNFNDYRGHGTFVAGIIAAKTNNGIGIAGINPGAVIMPVKVANENGETNSFDIFRGINYAVTHGARVINVSLGARTVSAFEQVAISRANHMGAFVVVASGNGGESITGFGPSSAQGAFAVGATDYEYRRSVISNFGPNNALLAPGDEIFSLVSKNNKHVKPTVRAYGYHSQSGTSFSAPMVAATASLLLAKKPKLTTTQLADMFMGTATDMEKEGWDVNTGAGFLNAGAVLRAKSKPYLTVMFTHMRINKDKKKKNESVDVFGTVRGKMKEYVIEAGKGKRAKKFKTIAGPFTASADYNFLARIPIKEHLRGSRDWVLRINVTDHAEQTHLATMPLEIVK